jgi:hypothetical protein
MTDSAIYKDLKNTAVKKKKQTITGKVWMLIKKPVLKPNRVMKDKSKFNRKKHKLNGC